MIRAVLVAIGVAIPDVAGVAAIGAVAMAVAFGCAFAARSTLR